MKKCLIILLLTCWLCPGYTVSQAQMRSQAVNHTYLNETSQGSVYFQTQQNGIQSFSIQEVAADQLLSQDLLDQGDWQVFRIQATDWYNRAMKEVPAVQVLWPLTTDLTGLYFFDYAPVDQLDQAQSLDYQLVDDQSMEFTLTGPGFYAFLKPQQQVGAESDLDPSLRMGKTGQYIHPRANPLSDKWVVLLAVSGVLYLLWRFLPTFTWPEDFKI
ncbi:hypothetical protein ACWOBE_05575 [Hutsoniella sourekii]